jgi:hypothetical protein
MFRAHGLPLAGLAQNEEPGARGGEAGGGGLGADNEEINELAGAGASSNFPAGSFLRGPSVAS